MKKIALLIRTYNSEKTIEETIKSALNQDFPQEDCEVVIIDDGSTDRTLDVLKPYQNNIKIVLTGHVGAVQALNFGLKNIQTPYYMILDSDDTVEPTILSHLYQPLAMNPDLGFAYGDYTEYSVGKTSSFVTTENIFNTIAGGILLPTEQVKRLGGYDPTLFFSEYNLLIQLLKQYSGIRVQESLYHYRRRLESLTANDEMVKKGMQQLFDKYGKEFPIRSYNI